MPDVDQPIPLLFRQGLQREFDTDLAAEGASRLINWQPGPDGSLRVRRNWQRASLTGAPAAKKGRSIAYLPVQAGYMNPIVRQRRKKSRKGSALTFIETPWWKETNEGSCLIAVLSYTTDPTKGDVATSVLGVTPPTDWTSVLTVHGNDSPSTISLRIYKYEDAPELEGDMTFTFTGGTCRRAQLEIFEAHGIAAVDAEDVIKSASGYSTKPDTGISAATDAAVAKELVIAVVSGKTADKTIKPSDWTEDYQPHRDHWDPPFNSTGRENYWLNQMVARKVINQDGTQRFSASYDATAQEDDAKSRWVAALVTFKAKLRSVLNDKDYYLVTTEKAADTHGLQVIDLDQLVAGTWTEAAVAYAQSGSVTNEPIAMATGNGGILLSSRDINLGPLMPRQGILRWDGELLIRINRSPRGRAIAWHRGRFYCGGTKHYPNRLYWSKLYDETFWEIEEDYINIGGDGETLLDACSTEHGLLIAKRDRLYLMTGPASQPAVIELDGGTGMAGKCITRIPGGAIVVGEDHIWLFEGGHPKLLSRPLDDWWQNSGRLFAYGAYVNGLVYLLGAQENTCAVYDTKDGIWWTDQTPMALRAIFAWDSKEVVGVVNDHATDFVLFQRHPGGSRSRDENYAQSFEAVTQELMLGTPSRPVTPKWLHVAFQKRNYQAGHPPIVVTPYYDGVAQTPRQITEANPNTNRILGNGDHRARLDVGVQLRSAAHKVQYKFAYAAAADNSTVIDIEAIELIVDTEEMR